MISKENLSWANRFKRSGRLYPNRYLSDRSTFANRSGIDLFTTTITATTTTATTTTATTTTATTTTATTITTTTATTTYTDVTTTKTI